MICSAKTVGFDVATKRVAPSRTYTKRYENALLVIRSVKCDADKEGGDGKHEEANENIHPYSSPISSMRR